jgi:hypothetical protein
MCVCVCVCVRVYMCVCVLSIEFSKFNFVLKTVHEYVCAPILCALPNHERHIGMRRISAVSDE